jgi:hypothetical protein
VAGCVRYRQSEGRASGGCFSGTAGSRLITARALAHEALLQELMPALRGRGIRPLLIKGPVTIALLYPDDPGTRDADDIDLLVSDADFAPAEAVLAGHGFRHKLEGARDRELDLHEHAWLRDGPLPVAIDLHRAPSLVPGAALFDLLARDAVETRVGGVAVEVPTDAASTLIVALHAAQDGSRSPRALADLRRAALRLPEVTWRQAVALATELGVRGELRLGLETVPEGGPYSSACRCARRPPSGRVSASAAARRARCG